MPPRLNNRHQQCIKDKIQGSQLVNALQNHALGKIDLVSTQVDSAKFLLNKLISNAPTVLAGDQDNPIVTQSIPPPNISIDEWLKRYKNVDTTDG